MKQIPLTQGKFALVDDEDYERLSAHKWCVHRHGRRFYAVRGKSRRVGGGLILMHREILDATGIEIDHISGDGLDNRRANLRPANRSQNAAAFNHVRTVKTSQYRGVSWHGRGAKWRAAIRQLGKDYYLGLFDSEEDAARAYDAAAKQFFGEFASINLP